MTVGLDYTTLTLPDVATALDRIAHDTPMTFGGLDLRQLNWQPDSTRWSVAQCLAHLLMTNRLMRRAADEALQPVRPRTVWQRVPGWPGLVGRLLVRSQAPTAARRFTAAPQAQPPAGEIPSDILERFAEQQRELASWVRVLDARQAAGASLTSPFARFLTYSVLDGCRLIVAHDHRHFEQARHVMRAPQFPSNSPLFE